MNSSRVGEILKATETIDVTYEGSRVWINSLNKDQDSAIVHPVGQHQQKFQVPVDKLVEEHVEVGG